MGSGAFGNADVGGGNLKIRSTGFFPSTRPSDRAELFEAEGRRQSALRYDFGFHMARDVVVLWREGDWHCDLRPSRMPGEARLLVCFRERVVSAESVNTGLALQTRAEILRLRVVRGHLRAPE